MQVSVFISCGAWSFIWLIPSRGSGSGLQENLLRAGGEGRSQAPAISNGSGFVLLDFLSSQLRMVSFSHLYKCSFTRQHAFESYRHHSMEAATACRGGRPPYLFCRPVSVPPGNSDCQPINKPARGLLRYGHKNHYSEISTCGALLEARYGNIIRRLFIEPVSDFLYLPPIRCFNFSPSVLLILT